ncbi:MAG: hypothetical protein RLZZ501_136 [Pseudomonadota bacterium]|jgi:integrase
MARGSNKLTAVAVSKMKAPGRYADGGGLYLQVGPTGGKSWLFRFTRQGRAREMGLGPLSALSLAEAREKASEARKVLLAGADPLEAREAEKAKAEAEDARGMTFTECAEAFIAAHEPTWRNPKHRQQWRNTLKTYAEPVFGGLSVAAVDLAMVMKVLEPIWREKPETASRLRGRVESVLDWAAVRGYRQGENPARWRGHLDKLLPARSKVATVEHHAALPYAEVAAFLADLRGRPALAARALEFVILTGARTSEALKSTWGEVDLAAAVWTIPGERMKAGREHRVPLSPQAVALLADLGKVREVGNEWVFPGTRPMRPLSQMALLMLLRRMERGDLTAHGFRSTFRDWTAEQTAFPGEVAEAALAHVVGDKVEAAYRRGDLFDKRRRLMEAWADYCDRPAGGGAVVPIRG